MLRVVLENRDDDPVKQPRRAVDQVQVSVRRRIKRPRVDDYVLLRHLGTRYCSNTPFSRICEFDLGPPRRSRGQ